jgi:putative ABC transport system permease protein
MVRWEALAVTGFGVLVGLAVAAATLVPFGLAIAETSVPYLPWQVVAGVITGALLLGLGASELSARNVLRRDPIEAIGRPGMTCRSDSAFLAPARSEKVLGQFFEVVRHA